MCRPSLWLGLSPLLFMNQAAAVSRGSPVRVGVIGAGAAGLVSAKVLAEGGCAVTVFEKDDRLGGTWRYIPGQSVMYSSLRTNLPKEIMAYSPEDPFPPMKKSFLGHEEVLSYLEQFVVKYRLRDLIRFNTKVVNVDQDLSSDQNTWTITTRNLIQDSCIEKYEFEYVLICNGHYNTPYIPAVEELSIFQGRQLHSCDYDNPLEFENQRVLIVGGKSSGTDLAREIASCALEVHVSDRNHATSSERHDNITLHGGISCFTSDNQVAFKDGSSACIDTIVWCTGFLYDFPFLYDSRCLKPYAGPTRQVRGLFRYLFTNEHPTVAFVGLPYSVVPFPIFYLQAMWISSLISGKAKLPSMEERSKWITEHEEKLTAMGWLETKYHYLGNELQFEYMRFLAREADIDEEALMRYIDMLEEIYFDNGKHKPPYVGGPDTYREREYQYTR